MSFAYTFREGIAGFRRAPFAAFASTSALVVALVLIGVVAFVTYEYQVVVEYLRERVGEMEVFLAPVGEAEAQVLTVRIAAMPGVAGVTYISQEEARRVFAEDFGEEAALFDADEFLPASIRVRVAARYAERDSLRTLKSRFEAIPKVEEVFFDEDLLVRVTQNLRVVSLIGIVLASLVVLAALFLVSNTIRLTVYARRLLIRTMKLVGATDAFIQRPFVIEGLLQGLVAGLVAGALLWGLYLVVPAQFKLLSSLASLATAGGIVLVGIVIGWLGSLLAVRRFVRRVALH